MVNRKHLSLDSKYLQQEGTIILSGIQALVRLPLDQYRADQRKGLKTATLVSGYRGSPFGGIDLVMERSRQILTEHHVVFMPGVNEEVAATAIMGSQLANLMPEPKYDGVLGMWYGKGPGVDRTGDAFKHANITGVGRYGGVLALAGDDPMAKSSTIPSHSEVALYDAQMPILYPGNVQEILDFGRWGFELSRYSGCWVGFKIVTNVADEFSTAEVSPDRITLVDPGFTYRGEAWRPTQNPALLAPYSLEQEREIYEGRLEAAKYWAAANGVNRIMLSGADDRLGIVAAGKTYYDVREALQQLGFDDQTLGQCGIRLLKIGMLYPLEPTVIRQFAAGLEEVLVIEEKRAFIELFLRDALYNLSDRPRIVGKRDEKENFLVRGDSELEADEIGQILADRLAQYISSEQTEQTERIKARLDILRRSTEPLTLDLPMVARTPYFCSGCPHSRSTLVPDGSMAAAGIGCHTLAILMDRNTTGVTQMGGEGAQWVGAAPFSHIPHIFQNIGDGTLFHSGTAAIRHALTTEANMTYKILYNGAVAMTGGQHADGEMPIPELTCALQAEGIKRTIVVSSEPEKYSPDTNWADNAEVWPRGRLDEAQRVLRDIPGITALIYDQPCATELRRKRRRGLADEPDRRIFINEAVCEGCGDCGVKSNCLSVFPVETEFGRKTQIHQSSCNKDYTCLEGDCPAFMSVIPLENHKAEAKIYRVERQLPAPQLKVPADCHIYMMGIGGTGVVTINQVLGTAALLDGKYVASLDQTGLSQKGGAVVSNLKLFANPPDVSNKVAVGEADTYLVFDVLTGTTPTNLSRAWADKTIAVVSSSEIPTGAMIRSTQVHFPNGQRLRGLIEARTRAAENIYLDAIGLAEHLFGNHMPANLITVGAAYQAGVIPLSAEAIEEAITLNGVAVEANINAFRVGRLVVADPDWVGTLTPKRPGAVTIRPQLTPKAQALVDEVGVEGELKRLLEIRVPELIAYQNLAYARDYVAFVKQVAAAEAAARPGQTQLSENVARYLFKLMAYKDEYEVARLYLKPEVTQALTEQFGEGAQVTYHLHPPLLRYLGMTKKLKLGQWFNSVYRLLVSIRWLRGTPLDPFGRTAVRRLERALIDEYRTLIEETLATLSPTTYDHAVKLAALPDMIRGYEEIKLNTVKRFREAVQEIKVEAEIKEAPEPELAL